MNLIHMVSKRFLRWAFLCLIMLSFVGCETDNEDAVKITPSSASLGRGGSAVFTASGGSGSYRWALSNSSAGRLSATMGASVTYTATKVGSNQFLNVLDENGNIVAQAIISQPGSNTSASGSQSSSSTGASGSQSSNTDNLVEGKLKWESAPPKTISSPKSFDLRVSGASGITNLIWSISAAANNETNKVNIIEFVGSYKGVDKVTLRASHSGFATVVVEDTKAKGGKSRLSADITIN